MASIFKSRRLWGLTGTGFVLSFVVFVVFGRINLSWIMPDTDRMARTLIEVWPRLPFFTLEKKPVNGGKAEEVYYTVPTRQLTPQEIVRMGATNGVARPAAPR